MDFDVLIVGAGPAGTAAAYPLAAHGRRVLMLDRYDFPRLKPCAGGLTIKALNLLPYSVAPVLERSTTGMTIGIRSSGGDLSEYLTKDAHICSFAVRSAFDGFNFEKALSRAFSSRRSRTYRQSRKPATASPSKPAEGASRRVI